MSITIPATWPDLSVQGKPQVAAFTCHFRQESGGSSFHGFTHRNFALMTPKRKAFVSS
jgi:hypothetical protein